jgi:hypothetical protein
VELISYLLFKTITLYVIEYIKNFFFCCFLAVLENSVLHAYLFIK